ncbi:MAG: hypothetical protein WBH85_06200 [Thermoanaerobaculia bacterium]
MKARLTFICLLVASTVVLAAAPSLSPEQQIAAAVSPAPPEARDTATVLGHSPDGGVQPLRQGTGDLICLGDDPSDDRFHVACYHQDLEPFMARGRQLRAQDVSRDEVQRIREEEIIAGELVIPPGPTALYSLTGPAGSFDPATGEVSGANRVFVVYIPYATEESTGLPPKPLTDGAPWLMSAGKPWAHIMVVQSAEAQPEP